MTNANIVVLALTPLILWRVYKRMQRLTTRQQSRAWRHWMGVLLFSAAIAALAAVSLSKPLALAGIVGGATIGAGLGLVALRRTGFERIGNDFFFTPFAPIGIAISVLFLCRMLYRAYEFYLHGAQQMSGFASSPLTLLIFGTVAGYYVAYGSGLLRWRSAAAAGEAKQ